MPFTREFILSLYTNKSFINILKKNGFKRYSYNIDTNEYSNSFYDYVLLEGFKKNTDIHLSFTIDELDYDGYIRLNNDGSIRLRYYTEYYKNGIVINRLRETCDIDTLDFLIDVLINKINHILYIRELNRYGEETFKMVELKI